ncbi:ABC transporter permease (plasmid) [Mesorhizobium sp. ORM8.1]
MNYIDLMLNTSWGLYLVVGALVTAAVSSTALCLGAALGSLIAWAKLRGGLGLRIFADGCTTFLRGIPDLLVIYLFYFGGGSFLTGIAGLFGHHGFVDIPAFWTGACALAVISSAYQAEVFRAAFLAIPRGELEAAKAIGMHTMLLFRRIIVPQALRTAIPGLANCWQLLLKESALISITGLAELLRRSQYGSVSTGEPFDFYLTAGGLYLILTIISGWGFANAERRAARGVKRI